MGPTKHWRTTDGDNTGDSDQVPRLHPGQDVHGGAGSGGGRLDDAAGRQQQHLQHRL